MKFFLRAKIGIEWAYRGCKKRLVAQTQIYGRKKFPISLRVGKYGEYFFFKAGELQKYRGMRQIGDADNLGLKRICFKKLSGRHILSSY